jgi:hypothetical protein
MTCRSGSFSESVMRTPGCCWVGVNAHRSCFNHDFHGCRSTAADMGCDDLDLSMPCKMASTSSSTCRQSGGLDSEAPARTAISERTPSIAQAFRSPLAQSCWLRARKSGRDVWFWHPAMISPARRTEARNILYIRTWFDVLVINPGQDQHHAILDSLAAQLERVPMTARTMRI